ncbi:PREDICTED: F-box/LRR-repeat protein 12-like, partial [Pterocles gutturalis]|uniref:F-box/LRR-repeat protein 12-like n=1 Tax=Pterocles gutturalis TaxID=240206 RepID=UPI00052870F3
WFTTAALPQLQHLVVRTVPAFSDFHLFNISSRCRLKTLNLSGTYRLTDSGIQKAAPHRYMKRLRFLEISDAPSLTNAGLDSLTTLQRLETLSLDL